MSKKYVWEEKTIQSGEGEMLTIVVEKLRENPRFTEKAAQWFSTKWEIPTEAYYDSMKECIEQKSEIPQWYIVLDNSDEIIAGAGIIHNDFHDRKDLSPNLCALFVDEKYRKQGIAKYILDFARQDLGNMGFKNLYLVTDHTEFYEKCGWMFLTTVNDDEGIPERMYMATTL